MAIRLRNHTDCCIEVDLRDGVRLSIPPGGISPAILVERTYGNTHLPGWLERRVVSQEVVSRSYADACALAMRVLEREGRQYQEVLTELCSHPRIDERTAWELVAKGVTEAAAAQKIVDKKRVPAPGAKAPTPPNKPDKKTAKKKAEKKSSKKGSRR